MVSFILKGVSVIMLLLLTACSNDKPGGKDNWGGGGNGGGGSVAGRPAQMAIGGMDLKLKSPQRSWFRSVSAPTSPEYEGIGVRYGAAVVEGLKLYITGIDASGAQSANIMSFTNSEVIEIAKGYTGFFAREFVFPYGDYNQFTISYENKFSLKAWAYLDTNNNNVVDTIIYTTSNGTVMSNITESDPAVLVGSNIAGYDYQEIQGLYGQPGGSMVNEYTSLPNVLHVTEATNYTNAEGIEVPTPSTYYIDIRVDSYRGAYVWDGNTNLSLPGFPFTSAHHSSNKPAFAMPYMTAFVVFNDTNATSQTFKISENSSFPANDTHYGNILFSGEGVPYLGRFQIADGVKGHLPMGQFISVFSTNSIPGVYNFWTGDADLLYNRDTNSADSYITGFTNLAAGVLGTLTNAKVSSTNQLYYKKIDKTVDY